MKMQEQEKRKHKAALAPNFIHSCDAAHLTWTVNAAWKSGIHSFRMVHDSYATHAADMDELSEILREEFITLHQKSELLPTFLESIQRDTTSESKYDSHPDTGNFDLAAIKDSQYFFA